MTQGCRDSVLLLPHLGNAGDSLRDQIQQETNPLWMTLMKLWMTSLWTTTNSPGITLLVMSLTV
jgi:hypothetical protein